MGVLVKLLHVTTASIITFVVTFVCGILSVIILGVLAPLLTMILLFGRSEVEDSPGGGGMILFITIPLAGMLVLIGIIPFWILIYQKVLRGGSSATNKHA
jgi:hypothetical protein